MSVKKSILFNLERGQSRVTLVGPNMKKRYYYFISFIVGLSHHSYHFVREKTLMS